MRTSLRVEGGSVCAKATKPIGRRTERVEPGTSAGRQRIRPVTWITWQTQQRSSPFTQKGFLQNVAYFDLIYLSQTLEVENRNNNLAEVTELKSKLKDTAAGITAVSAVNCYVQRSSVK